MTEQKNRGMNVLQWILELLLLSSVLYFILGQAFLPGEKFAQGPQSTTFHENWERVFPDGSRQAIMVPGQCDVPEGEVLVIEKQLSQNQENTWFCIRSSQQDIRVYVDDELRQEYTTKDTRLAGKNSVSMYVFFEVTEEDAAKTLRMEIVSNSPYSGYVNEIFVGEQMEIWRSLFGRYFLGTVIALFMLLLSLAVVVYSCIIQHIYKKKMEIVFLGVGLLIASIWLIAESRLRQLVFPNNSVASDVGFLMVILMPYPFLAYVNVIQKRRYQKVYMAMSAISIANFVFATIFHFGNIMDFSQTMGVSHGIIILMIGIFTVTVMNDVCKGDVKDYPEVAVGIGGVMLAGIQEIYLVYDKASLYNGVALCLGMVFLLFTAGIKTGRDMLKIEKEKHLAIVANESKSKFLANMSHEIRTPINTIIGMNEMILRENKDEATLGYARNINNAGRMLIELINDILDVSKLEVGKLEITENPYRLTTMLNDAMLSASVRAHNKNLDIRLEQDKSLPAVVKGDEIRIKQILNNLLSNAVKYTKQGSITLAAKGAKTEMGFVLMLSVKDTGIGIKQEDIAGLFDSFRRMDLNRNRNVEGTGLGLSITKELVDQMHGRIEVESEYGKGSCFTVWLPQEIIEEGAEEAEEQKKEENTACETVEEKVFCAPDASILVVDDKEINLIVIEALLKRTGVKMDFAGGGKECLEKSKHKKYDLILMDHMMPEPDGVQTLHMIKEDAENKNQETPVIVLTANAISGVAEEYLKEGFTDYLSKPVEYQRLEAMLEKYLQPNCQNATALAAATFKESTP